MDVFIRNWYKWQYNQYGQKTRVPHAGRKVYLVRGVSEQEARRICGQYNDTHNPGPLSRKAEYTS